jgi:hypothetical protein
MLAFATKGYSQVSGYAFLQSTEAYTAVVGTSSTAAGDDGIENAIPIGFTFNYEGVACTHFCVSTNGWIKMGNAATTGNTGTANYTNAFSATASNRPLIAPFWDDNNLGSGNIQYVVTGSAPNRILEVGWDNVNIGGGGSTSASAFASFKLRLYETTNVIDFVYGPVMDQAGTLTASVGLNGASSFLSVTPAAVSTVSSVTANNSIAATTNLVGKKYTFTPPSCTTPVGTAISAVTTTTATISWSAVVPAPATGYEYVVSTSNVTPAGAGTATAAVSVPVTGLLPATTYYVFVRSNCGSGFSAWSSSVSFVTLCNAFSTPFTETFENAGSIPNCWSMSGGEPWRFSNTGTGNHIGNNGVITGTTTSGGYFAWVDDSLPDFSDVTLTSPLINASTLTSPRLTFYELSNNEGNQNSTLTVDVWDGAAWNNVGVYNSNTIGGWEKKIISLSSLTITGNIQVRFVYSGDTTGFYDDIAIDDVTIEQTPSCIEPSGITASSITTTTATISWTAAVPTPASGYEYVVSTSNVVPAVAGTPTAAISVPVTGLSPSTTYYVFVRSNCGSGFSAWSSFVAFTTPCTFTTVPYLQDFESAVLPAVPSCTSVINNGTGNNWIVTNNPGSGFTSKTLQYSYDSFNSADAWFFTQGISLTAGTSYRIKYNYGSASTFFVENLKVAYGLNPDVVSMTNPLADHPAIGSAALLNNSVDFVPSVTGVYYFGFNAYSDADELNLYVDNINITVTPACEAPSNLVVSNITTSAADINWDAVPGSVNYEYILDQVATDPAGAGTSTTAIVYNASGLAANTTYYFHVRNNCGAQFGAWSTISFTTLALPPANDDCTGGISLTPGSVFTDYPVIATNAGATDSAPPTQGCGSYAGGDVWYTVTVPPSGSITIETNNNAAGGSTITDTGLAVYDGTDCGSLNLVQCDDDSSTDGFFSKIALTGRTPGELLFIDAWQYGNDTVGTFKIAAYDASLSAASFDMNGFAAYPNPVKDNLNISYTKDISNVSVHNLLGQEVLNKSFNSMQAKVDLSKLANGAYLVKVTVDGLVKTIKIVKE